MKIRVKGLASGKVFELEYDQASRPNLMDFLSNHGLPISSSCHGEGVCKKCMVDVLVNQQGVPMVSCQINHAHLSSLLLESGESSIGIEIGYL